jgi:hypothetical protein
MMRLWVRSVFLLIGESSYSRPGFGGAGIRTRIGTKIETCVSIFLA